MVRKTVFDDYYSFHPTIQLRSTVYVTGFFGTPVVQSARFVQALSGIQVIDVERLLEHKIGERLAHFLCKYQKDDLYRLEHEVLQQVSSEQPSIVVLRPSTLRYRRNFDLLSEQNGIAVLQSKERLSLQLQDIHTQQRTERLVDLDYRLPISDLVLHAEMVVWKRYIPSSWYRLKPDAVAPSGIASEVIQVLSDHFDT